MDCPVCHASGFYDVFGPDCSNASCPNFKGQYVYRGAAAGPIASRRVLSHSSKPSMFDWTDWVQWHDDRYPNNVEIVVVGQFPHISRQPGTGRLGHAVRIVPSKAQGLLVIWADFGPWGLVPVAIDNTNPRVEDFILPVGGRVRLPSGRMATVTQDVHHANIDEEDQEGVGEEYETIDLGGVEVDLV